MTPVSLVTRRSRALLAAAAALLVTLATSCTAPGPAADWRSTLARELPRLGHRNFVVIADSAYPLQNNPGVQTILADAEHLEVVDVVLDAIAASPHVRPVIWLDAELGKVPEKMAPGVERYRAALNQRLGGLDVHAAPHEDIIMRLDETANLYHVLLLKTDLAIPYTSVFVELQCGYWGDQAEQILRAAMSGAR